jgi:hypothetical protein
MNNREYVYRPRGWLSLLLAALTAVGIAIFLKGAFAEPQRAWGNFLLASNYLLGIGLGSAVLIALFYVTGARWSTVLLRIPEALTVVLPVACLGSILVLVFRGSLYPWSNGQSAIELSPFQHGWLERSFFLARAFIYVGLWLAFAFALVGLSRRTGQGNVASFASRNTGLSSAFLVVFSITYWLASTDWIMSLEPQWSSTIFGLYNFAGSFLAALAAVSALAICLYWRGAYQDLLGRKHFHDLGTLLFGFSSFWMYVWFCQYMLIWYVNNPEETSYFLVRRGGDGPNLLLGNMSLNWGLFLMLANVTLNWGVPFVVLLFRRAKESPTILLVTAGIVLVGHWLDLYLMILPPISGNVPVIAWWEAGLMLATLGMAVILFRRALARAPLMPKLLPDPAIGDADILARQAN